MNDITGDVAEYPNDNKYYIFLFDKIIFDTKFGKNNNYYRSKVREKLLEWYKENIKPYIDSTDIGAMIIKDDEKKHPMMSDALFLLSVSEAKLFDRDVLSYNDYLWLRSPGSSSSYAAYVYSDGTIYPNGYNVDYCNAVRPAMLIRKDSKLLTAEPKKYDRKYKIKAKRFF